MRTQAQSVPTVDSNQHKAAGGENDNGGWCAALQAANSSRLIFATDATAATSTLLEAPVTATTQRLLQQAGSLDRPILPA